MLPYLVGQHQTAKIQRHDIVVQVSEVSETVHLNSH